MASDESEMQTSNTVHILPCRLKTPAGPKPDTLELPSSGEFSFFGRRLISGDAEFPPEFRAVFACQDEEVFEVTKEFPRMKLWGHDTTQGPCDEIPRLLNYVAAVSKMHLA